jgi:tRNA 2-thiouridine synthesizing protein A
MSGASAAKAARMMLRIDAGFLARRLLHNRVMEFTQELDARGLNCPLPILRTKKALSALQAGQVLKIVATDPGSVRDFQGFAKQTGHELLAQSQADNEFVFFMRKRQ